MSKLTMMDGVTVGLQGRLATAYVERYAKSRIKCCLDRRSPRGWLGS